MMMWRLWPNMMGGLSTGLGFIWIVFLLLFALAIIAGVILLIIWALRKPASTQQSQQAPLGKAMEILKERYARGELTKEEYENIKKDMS